ncbi:MAG: glycosyltransferase, partial [Longimicrobiales bacterium]
MRKPGVLLIGNYPPPFGGVPKHIEDLVPGLVRRGWRVHVLSSGTSGTEQREGFTVHKDARSLPRRRFDTVSFLWRVSREHQAGRLREYAGLMPLRSWASYMGRVALGAQILDGNSIDVIAGYNLLAGAPVASILGEIYALPVVISNFGELYSHRSLAERERGMIRRMTERSAQLLCMTRHCAESYELLGLNPPVRILPYGLDLDRFSPGDGSDAREALGLRAGDRVV